MNHIIIHRDCNAIKLWLLVCTLLVAAMVCLGGYTRLSGSGLSITDWKPVHGIIPPLNDAEWKDEFAAYQKSPQFEKVNSSINVDEFKEIFWPEYLHRLLGRLVGVVLLVPLIIFMVRRSFTADLGWRMAAIFVLGGIQGVIGWLMVKSGLVNDPRVSHLRLALHLSMAFAIFAALFWSLMDVNSPQRTAPPSSPINQPSMNRLVKHKKNDRNNGMKSYAIWFALLCFQIILGAFMAGLHAGMIYNTWPTMNGQWFPEGSLAAPAWYNDITLIQFMHRTLAIFLAISYLFWWFFYRNYVKNNKLGMGCLLVALIVAVQFLLGVLTLINAVPLPLALTHQMTGLLLFAMSLKLLHMNVHAK